MKTTVEIEDNLLAHKEYAESILETEVRAFVTENGVLPLLGMDINIHEIVDDIVSTVTDLEVSTALFLHLEELMTAHKAIGNGGDSLEDGGKGLYYDAIQAHLNRWWFANKRAILKEIAG